MRKLTMTEGAHCNQLPGETMTAAVHRQRQAGESLPETERRIASLGSCTNPHVAGSTPHTPPTGTSDFSTEFSNEMH